MPDANPADPADPANPLDDRGAGPGCVAAPARRERGDYAVEVRPSRIDGHGAFAAEPIPARRKIGEIGGRSMSVKEARLRAKTLRRIMIVEVGPRLAIDASGSDDPLRYTNHSCRPNAVLHIAGERVEVHTLRDVAPGEELTVDYGSSHHEGRLRCRCGMPECAGRL